jgi:hypothetical protein
VRIVLLGPPWKPRSVDDGLRLEYSIVFIFQPRFMEVYYPRVHLVGQSLSQRIDY